MKIDFYIKKNYGIVMGTAVMLQVTGFSRITLSHGMVIINYICTILKLLYFIY
jgi:hypothetical protein